MTSPRCLQTFLMFRRVTTANSHMKRFIEQSWFIFWLYVKRWFEFNCKSWPGNTRSGVYVWTDCSMKTLHDRYLHVHIFPRHLQLRSFARDLNPEFPAPAKPAAFDLQYLKPLPSPKRVISQLHEDILCSLCATAGLHNHSPVDDVSVGTW